MDVIHTSKHIGMLEEGSPTQPGTIAFIVCLLLVIIGFFVLLVIYIKNHQARVREFEIELRKRKVLRERERSIALTEAEAGRQAKRQLLEDQDIALRYRHVQGYEGYEDGDGSVSPLSASSPFAYSQPAGFSPKGRQPSSEYDHHQDYYQQFNNNVLPPTTTTTGGGYDGGNAAHYYNAGPPPSPPATTVSQTRWGDSTTTTHREMAFNHHHGNRNNAYDGGGYHTTEYTSDDYGQGDQPVIFQADSTTTRWGAGRGVGDGGGGGGGVRLFDPDEANSIQMTSLPRRPDPSYY